MKYVFANTTAQRGKKLNPHANSPAKKNEINPKYENTRKKIQRLLTNENPGFLYKVKLNKVYFQLKL